MKYNFYPEEKYSNILKIIPPFHYQITTSDELLSQEIFPPLKMPFIGACIATGGTTQVNLKCEHYEIPEGSRIAHLRWFREDQQLSKAYDIIIFPERNGNIVSVTGKYAKDHHLPLLKAVGLEGLIETNHLPIKKSGHLSEYGAYVPVIIDFTSQEEKYIKS